MTKRKNTFNVLWLCVTVLLIIGGCQSTKKIPAGDISVYKKFADEIKIMQSKASPDGELKFSSAKILFENIDFTFLRKPKDLIKILGSKDAMLINDEGKEYIQYRYKYADKYIWARFLLVRNMLVAFRLKSNVIDEQEI